MTLDEAIKHAEEVVEEQENKFSISGEFLGNNADCKKCAEEHRQLAEWLKELKQLREQTRWIPVSEGLPEDREIILFSTKTDCVFVGRYFDDNTNCQWYAFCDEAFAWNNVVTAWMPLPEPYKAERSEE